MELRIEQNHAKYSCGNVNRKSITTAYEDVLSSIVNSQPSPKQEAALPSYHLTQEQIEYLKSNYNVSEISADRFHQLMTELSNLGVVAESDANIVASTENGLAMVRRPIILGLYKQETHEKLFGYSGFENGNVIKWIDQYIERNKSALDWLKNSKDDLNNGLQNLSNRSSLEKYNQDATRLKDIMSQLI